MLRIRTLWLFGLAALALGPAGCVTGDDDDAGFLASWQLARVGGGAVSCDEAGTDKVVLQGQNVRTGFQFRNEFPCEAGSGISQALPSGPYNLRLSLLGPGGREVSGIGSQQPFELFRRGTFALDTVEFRIQAFQAVWSVVRGGAAITCEQANAVTVRLVTRLGNDPKDVNYDFPCRDRSGVTTAVPIGAYTLQVQLLDPAGGVLSAVPAMAFPVDDQRPANLPPITFEVR